MKEVLFIRHAQSEGNELGLISAPAESPLTKKGKSEVEYTKAFLDKEFPNPDIIFCTNTLRVKQTIQFLGLNALDQVYSRNLEEIDTGIYNEHTWNDFETIHPNVNPFFKFRFPQGESYLDLLTRSWDYFNKDILKSEHKRILIVAHGGSIGGILHRLLNLSDESFPVFDIDNASVSRVFVSNGNTSKYNYKIKYINYKPGTY